MPLPPAQRDGFLETERKYYEAWRACEVSDAGTTALALLVWGGTLYLANLGDSRAVLCSDGKTVALTRDHRPTCQRELERITVAGGFVSADHRLNGCLSVSRAFGNYSEGGLKAASDGSFTFTGGPLTAEPEVYVHRLTEKDEFLVMACDGLWDQFSNERVIELARDSLKDLNDPQACVEELVRRVHTARGVGQGDCA